MNPTELEQTVLDLYKTGEKVVVIGQRLGLTDKQVCYIAQKNGLRRNYKATPARVDKINKLLAQGLTPAEIRVRMRISKEQLKGIFKRYHCLPRKRKPIQKKTLELIPKIKQLRDQGMMHWQIAFTLRIPKSRVGNIIHTYINHAR